MLNKVLGISFSKSIKLQEKMIFILKFGKVAKSAELI